MDLFDLVLCVFLPPVAAYAKVGFTKHLWINVVLTLLGGLPGVVHAFWLTLFYKD